MMSLNVENCYRCGRVHLKNLYGLCPNCLKEIEMQYEKCLKYLRDNRKCSINELSEATEVPIKQITKFIREGRLSLKGNPNMTYDCEVCGAQIRENVMCESCRTRLAKDALGAKEDEVRKKKQAEEESQATFKIKDRLQDRLK